MVTTITVITIKILTKYSRLPGLGVISAYNTSTISKHLTKKINTRSMLGLDKKLSKKLKK